MKTIDIVVPCYNEEEVLNNFYEVTRSWCDKIEGYDFRFILVDDGSRDRTVCIMRELAQAHPEVRYISFSRNFGKEAAMYAGLSNSTGDYVIVMDADLQHPPSMFPDFIAGIEEGHDCVAAKRTNRKGESKIRSFLSRRFYKLSNRMSDVKLEYGAVDYRIMTRRMVNSILRLSEVQRFSKGIFTWVGYDTKWIPYENVERELGTSKWNLRSLLRYAIDGITSFSTAPLRMVSAMGFFICFFAFLYMIYIVVKTLLGYNDVSGFPTIICLILFLGGLIEFSIGIIGEYIARIYMESKHRPIYIARESNIPGMEGVSLPKNSTKETEPAEKPEQPE